MLRGWSEACSKKGVEGEGEGRGGRGVCAHQLSWVVLLGADTHVRHTILAHLLVSEMRATCTTTSRSDTRKEEEEDE